MERLSTKQGRDQVTETLPRTAAMARHEPLAHISPSLFCMAKSAIACEFGIHTML